jgi:hypothetical protein
MHKIGSDDNFGMEARVGFEPTNRGFADLSLSHLGTAPCFSWFEYQNVETLIGFEKTF